MNKIIDKCLSLFVLIAFVTSCNGSLGLDPVLGMKQSGGGRKPPGFTSFDKKDVAEKGMDTAGRMVHDYYDYHKKTEETKQKCAGIYEKSLDTCKEYSGGDIKQLGSCMGTLIGTMPDYCKGSKGSGESPGTGGGGPTTK